MFAEVYLRSTPEQRIATCLNLMAASRDQVVWWVAFRHLFDMTVLAARSQIGLR
jgi:hypothetical protein